MISVPLTGAITAALAAFGISPTPALVGGVFLGVKATLILGGVLGVSKLWERFKAKKAGDENTSPEA